MCAVTLAILRVPWCCYLSNPRRSRRTAGENISLWVFHKVQTRVDLVFVCLCVTVNFRLAK